MRIVEGLPKPKAAPAQTGRTKPVPSREPKSLEGVPAHLKALQGVCYALETQQYKYEVCPFDNVTQLDVRQTWNPFWGILGIWDGWKEPWKESGGEVVGRFTDGTSCGSNSPREIEVTFTCLEEGSPTVSDIAEPEVCRYTAKLSAPEFCSSYVSPSESSPLRSGDGGHQDSVNEAPEHDGAEIGLGEVPHPPAEEVDVDVDGTGVGQSASRLKDLAAENARLRRMVRKLEELVAQGGGRGERRYDGARGQLGTEARTQSIVSLGDSAGAANVPAPLPPQVRAPSAATLSLSKQPSPASAGGTSGSSTMQPSAGNPGDSSAGTGQAVGQNARVRAVGGVKVFLDAHGNPSFGLT